MQCLEAGFGAGGPPLKFHVGLQVLAGGLFGAGAFQHRHPQTFLQQGGFGLVAADLLLGLGLTGLAVLELILQQVQLTHGAAILGQQAFVIAVELGDLVLANHGALLGLAQFHLDLLHLAFMAPLFLLALVLDGLAIVLQGVAGVQVFFFQ